MFDLGMFMPGMVVRVTALHTIDDDYTTIRAGELGTLVFADALRHIVRWDKIHRGLTSWDNEMVINTDDLDTLARIHYHAAGYPMPAAVG